MASDSGRATSARLFTPPSLTPPTSACSPSDMNTPGSRRTFSQRLDTHAVSIAYRPETLNLDTEQKEYIRAALCEFSASYVSRRSEVTSKIITSRDIPNASRILKQLSSNKYKNLDEVVEDFDVVLGEWIRLGDSGLHLGMKEELAAECEDKLLHCPKSAEETTVKREQGPEEDEDDEDGEPVGPSRKRRRT